MARAGLPPWAALAAWLLLSTCDASLQPGDQIPEDLVVPILDGNLTVPRDGSTNTPLVALGLDAADPFSAAMWLAPASLDDLLLRAPEQASFLFFSTSNDSAEADARWMRQHLMDRARELRLPPDHLDGLMQRLHFAAQPPAAVGGWLPQLLEQWRMPRRIIRVVAHPQPRSSGGHGSGGGGGGGGGGEQRGRDWGSGVAAGAGMGAAAAGEAPAGEQAAGRQPLGSIASGRLDAFYGWLPWPLTGLQANLSFAGWDCDWLPRERSSLRSRLSGSVALVALSAFPGGSEAGIEDAPPSSSSVAGSGSSSSSSSSSGGGSASSSSSSSRTWPLRARCSYARIVAAAQAAGARAVLLAAPPGRYPREANCSCPEECGAELGIPATMVAHGVGAVLRDVLRAGDRVNISFEEEQAPGLWAGVDASGRLFELGWPKVASLLHAVWAAQGQAYQQSLQERLAAPARVVPIFDAGAPLDSGGVLRRTLALPSWRKLAGRNRLELDMALSCPGSSDADCPPFDHVVQLFVCCGQADGMLPPCDPCQPTIWAGSSGNWSSSGGSSATASLVLPGAAGGHSGSARTLAAAAHEQAALGQGQEGQQNGKQLCGRELGRWVTPFRRRTGRWLTDVSALRPLLLPAPRLLRMMCTFTLQAPAWAGPWVPTLSLRFSAGPAEVRPMGSAAACSSGTGDRGRGSSGGAADAAAGGGTAAAQQAGQQPQQHQQHQQRQHQRASCREAVGEPRQQRVLPLPFSGGDFGPGYNNRTAAGLNFTTPLGLRRALLVARVTGHGWGPETSGCAEFCGTRHRFRVNGAEHEYGLSFEAAGTLWGCADQVPDGVVPNQHGTFLYGRNGWCPGQDVAPWLADVTSALRPAGQPNRITYRGTLLNGSEPGQPAGVLLMQSNLVFFLGC